MGGGCTKSQQSPAVFDMFTFGGSKETGAPERIRTSDPQIRSLVLYPAELRAPASGGVIAEAPGRRNGRVGVFRHGSVMRPRMRKTPLRERIGVRNQLIYRGSFWRARKDSNL